MTTATYLSILPLSPAVALCFSNGILHPVEVASTFDRGVEYGEASPVADIRSVSLFFPTQWALGRMLHRAELLILTLTAAILCMGVWLFPEIISARRHTRPCVIRCHSPAPHTFARTALCTECMMTPTSASCTPKISQARVL